MRYTVFCLLILVFLLAACKKDEPKIALNDLPEGDAASGEALFKNGKSGAAACSSCHSTDDTKQAGPGMEGYAERAGDRVDGQSAEEYTYYSLLRPSKYVVSGYSNVMPDDYEEKFNGQEIADLIAYLLTL